MKNSILNNSNDILSQDNILKGKTSNQNTMKELEEKYNRDISVNSIGSELKTPTFENKTSENRKNKDDIIRDLKNQILALKTQQKTKLEVNEKNRKITRCTENYLNLVQFFKKENITLTNENEVIKQQLLLMNEKLDEYYKNYQLSKNNFKIKLKKVKEKYKKREDFMKNDVKLLLKFISDLEHVIFNLKQHKEKQQKRSQQEPFNQISLCLSPISSLPPPSEFQVKKLINEKKDNLNTQNGLIENPNLSNMILDIKKSYNFQDSKNEEKNAEESFFKNLQNRISNKKADNEITQKKEEKDEDDNEIKRKTKEEEEEELKKNLIRVTTKRGKRIIAYEEKISKVFSSPHNSFNFEITHTKPDKPVRHIAKRCPSQPLQNYPIFSKFKQLSEKKNIVEDVHNIFSISEIKKRKNNKNGGKIESSAISSFDFETDSSDEVKFLNYNKNDKKNKNKNSNNNKYINESPNSFNFEKQKLEKEIEKNYLDTFKEEKNLSEKEESTSSSINISDFESDDDFILTRDKFLRTLKFNNQKRENLSSSININNTNSTSSRLERKKKIKEYFHKRINEERKKYNIQLL